MHLPSTYKFSDGIVRGIVGVTTETVGSICGLLELGRCTIVDTALAMRRAVRSNLRAIHSLVMIGGKQKRAYVTMVSSWHDVVGVEALIMTLKRHQARYPLVVMVDKSKVKFGDLSRLMKSDCIIVPVEPVLVNLKKTAQKSTSVTHTPNWAKLRVFGLMEFDRVVYLDPHVVLLSNLDDLFDAYPSNSPFAPLPPSPPPWRPPQVSSSGPNAQLLGERRASEMGLIARKRCLCMQCDEKGRLVYRHRCPYAPSAPPLSSPSLTPSASCGIDTSVLVLSPSLTQFQEMQTVLAEGIEPLPYAELDFLTKWFGGSWCEMEDGVLKTSMEGLWHPSSFDWSLRNTRALSFSQARPWSMDVSSLVSLARTFKYQHQDLSVNGNKMPEGHRGFRWWRRLLARPTDHSQRLNHILDAKTVERSGDCMVWLYLKWWQIYTQGKRQKRRGLVSRLLGSKQARPRFAEHAVDEYLEISPRQARRVVKWASQVRDRFAKHSQSPSMSRSPSPSLPGSAAPDSPHSFHQWYQTTLSQVEDGRIPCSNPMFHQLKALLYPEECGTETFWKEQANHS
uniref:Uncharacterized protein n=1 Tax=Lotharella globosa TaxID=91324 RepID=A0A7S3ZIG8_9EUKA